MRQSNLRSVLLAAMFLCSGCGRSDSPPTSPSTSASTSLRGTIVCLSPAASDLLVAMGLFGRIVGVSGYEANAALRKTLPNCGDYQRIDWERISDLKPGYLIIQGSKARLPTGITERCEAMGVQPIVLGIDRFADIESAVHQLGQALGADVAAKQLNDHLTQELADLHKDAKKTTPALIVLDDEGTAVVGRDNFINDALEAAGGENVITANGYPSIDNEKLLTLHPSVVFLLMPQASNAVVDRAKQALSESVAGSHIYAITSANALLPGTAVIDLAKQFADDIKASGA